MSSYYLCDYCGHPHDFSLNEAGDVYGCEADGFACGPKVMHDGYELPNEVCPYWKLKEDTDAD